MSNSKRLGICLLLSLLWHLFCLSFFSISFFDPGYDVNKQARVSFFGSILNSPILAVQLEGESSVVISQLPDEAEIKLAGITAAATSSLLFDKLPLDPEQFIELDLAQQRQVAVKDFTGPITDSSPRQGRCPASSRRAGKGGSLRCR